MTNDLPFAVWQLKFHNGFYQLAPFDLRHLDGSIETDVNSSEDENSSILESQPKTQQMPALISTAAPPATTNQDSPLQNSEDSNLPSISNPPPKSPQTTTKQRSEPQTKPKRTKPKPNQTLQKSQLPQTANVKNKTKKTLSKKTFDEKIRKYISIINRYYKTVIPSFKILKDDFSLHGLLKVGSKIIRFKDVVKVIKYLLSADNSYIPKKLQIVLKKVLSSIFNFCDFVHNNHEFKVIRQQLNNMI